MSRILIIEDETSIADLERLFRGKSVDARIELVNEAGETWWFYCRDEAEAPEQPE